MSDAWNEHDVSRRDFLAGTVGVAGGMLIPLGWPTPVRAQDAEAPAVITDTELRPLRFVHLSDIHIRPEMRAEEGYLKALEAVHALDPRPEFILTGGDLVHNARGSSLERAEALFDLFIKASSQSQVPMRHCIGNHDVLGWSADSPVEPTHPMFGKTLAMQRLGLDTTNYSFDAGGWRFCVVDNVGMTRNERGELGYQGIIDEPTMQWLDRQLAEAGNRPKLICTHIPLLSAAVFSYEGTSYDDVTPLPTSLIARDAKDTLELLNKHQVSTVLTGHLHQSDRIHYQHTTHIGQGAVSGAWWKGDNLGTPEGFGLFDLMPDGTFTHQYIAYDWQGTKER